MIDYEEVRDGSDLEFEASVKFFRTLKLKWAKYLMAKLAAGMMTDIDIYNDRELVSWRVYLKVFSDIRQKIGEDTENEKRKLYHPACRGYILTKVDVPVEEQIEMQEDDGDRGPADDYTEDAGSVYSDDDDEDEDDESEEESSEEPSDAEEEEDTDEEDGDDEEGKAGGGDDGSKGSKQKKAKGGKGAQKEGGADEEKGGAHEQQLAVVSLEDGGDVGSILDGASSASSPRPSPTKSKTAGGGNALVAYSQSGDSAASGSGTSATSRRTKEWNPELTSPIFFGYTYVPERMHDDSVAAQKIALREAEERAVQRTRDNRAQVLVMPRCCPCFHACDVASPTVLFTHTHTPHPAPASTPALYPQLLSDFQHAMKNQHANRERKIAKCQDDYDKARTARENDLRKLQSELPPVAFNAFKVRAGPAAQKPLWSLSCARATATSSRRCYHPLLCHFRPRGRLSTSRRKRLSRQRSASSRISTSGSARPTSTP